MIDLHTHVLPGLDDGAEDLEDSVEMMRLAAEDGTTEVVATPHSDLNYVFDPEAVAQAIQKVVTATGGAPRLYTGCELHLTYDNIQDCLAHPAKYAIAGGEYVLLEVPDFLSMEVLSEILARLRAAGLRPIVAHPERSPMLAARLNTLREWAGRDCLLQVTAASLLGRFGKRAEAVANDLLQSRHIHFVASDAHDTRQRPPILSAAYKHAVSRTDEAYAGLLFRANPSAVLHGEPMPEWAKPEPRSRWQRFFQVGS